MTGGEKAAVAVGVVAVGGVVGIVVWQLLKQRRAISAVSGQAPKPGATDSVGNIIASIGGSAVAQLGKEAGTYVADRLRSAFA